ncbi:hypothetical protein GUITHDRAFT_110264 [Guillardia theta CCMP2712]|uniref:Uncharacterized protein n=1 Tax=Guillardia theta (strain CCMP2712) TaxID=905079 RepID=L1J6W4_GUITC|nr:hypothetical protein GUITHDRAFT_110264 [Guillardia theta CCMP2712]EKX43810.1 hypothetical protein GUITHDRAFT_110264 [Guillardia theta CCMP2712]|eukprot:XP_005830790.1 hypothetical protein GUITHDRAFT_110264 [Guillardia theta CCMP2712]
MAKANTSFSVLKNPADWKTDWLCYLLCDGCAYVPYDSWEKGEDNSVACWNCQDRQCPYCCCVRYNTWALGPFLGDGGLCCKNLGKFCCTTSEGACYCEKLCADDGSYCIDDRTCFLRKERGEVGQGSAGKCCCARYQSECRLEFPLDDDQICWKNNGKCLCCYGTDECQCQKIDSAVGILACSDRFLCLLCSCFLCPERMFIELLSKRYWGEAKNAASESVEPLAASNFGNNQSTGAEQAEAACGGKDEVPLALMM